MGITGEDDPARTCQRIGSFDTVGRIMVAGNRNHRTVAVGRQPLQCAVEEVDRLGGRIEGVEQITGHKHGVHTLPFSDLADLLQHHLLLFQP